MSDQIELTGSAIMKRLDGELVPHTVGSDGSVIYYLWAITDQQLHKYLPDSYYGEFVDNADDLSSVTMQSQKNRGIWVFAPSSRLLEWFEDIEDIVPTKDAIKFAYVRMNHVEEHLDEGRSPVVEQILNSKTNLLYAYPLKYVYTLNNLMVSSFNDGMSETDVMTLLDDRYEQLVNDIATTSASAQPISQEPVDFSDEDDDNVEDLDDVGLLYDSDDYGETDTLIPDEEIPDDVLPTNNESFVLPGEEDVELDVSDSVATPENRPNDLEIILNKVKIPILKRPSIHAEDEQEDYREKVDAVRDDLNKQLIDYQNDVKQQLSDEYYKSHADANQKLDDQLDPESGVEQVRNAYNQVLNLNAQDIKNADILEKRQRDEHMSAMDSFHEAFINDAIAQAEKEWDRIKVDRYVEEPVRNWREAIDQTVAEQHEARLKRFNDWRQKIKNKKIALVDKPIFDKLLKEASEIASDLKNEYDNAYRELNRTEERLFNQSLIKPVMTYQQPVVEIDDEEAVTPETYDEMPEPDNQIDDDDDEQIFDDDNDELIIAPDEDTTFDDDASDDLLIDDDEGTIEDLVNDENAIIDEKSVIKNMNNEPGLEDDEFGDISFDDLDDLDDSAPIADEVDDFDNSLLDKEPDDLLSDEFDDDDDIVPVQSKPVDNMAVHDEFLDDDEDDIDMSDVLSDEKPSDNKNSNNIKSQKSVNTSAEIEYDDDDEILDEDDLVDEDNSSKGKSKKKKFAFNVSIPNIPSFKKKKK